MNAEPSRDEHDPLCFVRAEAKRLGLGPLEDSDPTYPGRRVSNAAVQVD